MSKDSLIEDVLAYSMFVVLKWFLRHIWPEKVLRLVELDSQHKTRNPLLKPAWRGGHRLNRSKHETMIGKYS